MIVRVDVRGGGPPGMCSPDGEREGEHREWAGKERGAERGVREEARMGEDGFIPARR